MPNYIVQAQQTVKDDQLDEADYNDLADILEPYYIVADSVTDALDSYHSNIPISCLDDFDIYTFQEVEEQVDKRTIPNRIPFEKKLEFIAKYRVTFRIISNQKWFPNTNNLINQLADLARKDLGYSKKTINVDIVKHLESIYKDNLKSTTDMKDFNHDQLSRRIIDVLKSGTKHEKALMEKLFPELFEMAKEEINLANEKYPIGDLYLKSGIGDYEVNVLLLYAEPSKDKAYHNDVHFYNMIAHNHWKGSVTIHKDRDFITHEELKQLVNGASTIRRITRLGKLSKNSKGVFFESAAGIPIQIHYIPGQR